MTKPTRSRKRPALSSGMLPGLEHADDLPLLGPAMAGLDEAGRGCLAGPVAAAAVILPEGFCLDGLTDSKKLSAAERERFAPVIRDRAVAWGIGAVWPQRIDSINILRASLEAMALAAASLRRRAGDRRAQPAFPGLLLIDGNKTIPEDVLAAALAKRPDAPALPRQKSVVKGDSLITAISAASVLAKIWRDRLMCALARVYPGYGFEIHKGYGTKAHLEALRTLGPCPIHRMTFRGVRPAGQDTEAGTDGSLLFSRSK